MTIDFTKEGLPAPIFAPSASLATTPDKPWYEHMLITPEDEAEPVSSLPSPDEAEKMRRFLDDSKWRARYREAVDRANRAPEPRFLHGFPVVVDPGVDDHTAFALVRRDPNGFLSVVSCKRQESQ